jgi:hypothetical protein
MRRACLTGLACGLALLGGATDAGARRFTGIDVEASGKVTIDFHGDQAAGCESRGVCDVGGTVTWRPGRAGSIGVTEGPGRRVLEAQLAFDPVSDDPPLTSAQVTGGGSPELCADVRSFELLVLPLRRQPRGVEIGLPPHSGLLATRCAGPLDLDVLTLLPRVRLSVSALRGRPRRIDLSGERPFAAAGFSGTVRSDVVLRTGQVEVGTDSPATGSSTPSGPTEREVVATYRVERVEGAVHADFAGLADSRLCAPFGACDLAGGVTWQPSASSGRARLSATASARHPATQLRAALGLGPGPARRGIQAYGTVDWNGGGGTVSALVAGGSDSGCSDSAPVPRGEVYLFFAHGVVHSRLTTGEGDPLRSRCPGPLSDDVTGGGWLATGTAPAGVFRGPRVELHLRTGHVFEGTGYGGQTSADVTVVLRRVRVGERTYRGAG